MTGTRGRTYFRLDGPPSVQGELTVHLALKTVHLTLKYVRPLVTAVPISAGLREHEETTNRNEMSRWWSQRGITVMLGAFTSTSVSGQVTKSYRSLVRLGHA